MSRIAHDLPALYVRNTHTKSPSGSRFILVPVSDSERLFLAVLTLFQCAFFLVLCCYFLLSVLCVLRKLVPSTTSGTEGDEVCVLTGRLKIFFN